MADLNTVERQQLEERAETLQARVLAFLANIRPDPNSTLSNSDLIEHGRARLTEWMVAAECGQDVRWNAKDCGDILRFLGACVPWRCYCNDSHAADEPVRPDLTCGYHLILNMLEDQVGQLGQREGAHA